MSSSKRPIDIQKSKDFEHIRSYFGIPNAHDDKDRQRCHLYLSKNEAQLCLAIIFNTFVNNETKEHTSDRDALINTLGSDKFQCPIESKSMESGETINGDDQKRNHVLYIDGPLAILQFFYICHLEITNLNENSPYNTIFPMEIIRAEAKIYKQYKEDEQVATWMEQTKAVVTDMAKKKMGSFLFKAAIAILDEHSDEIDGIAKQNFANRFLGISNMQIQLMREFVNIFKSSLEYLVEDPFFLTNALRGMETFPDFNKIKGLLPIKRVLERLTNEASASKIIASEIQRTILDTYPNLTSLVLAEQTNAKQSTNVDAKRRNLV